MKKIAFTGLVAAIIALTVISCQKTEKLNPISNPSGLKTVAVIGTTPDVCGSYTTTLIAGQNISAGTVTVSNDEETTFVTFTTTNGWMIESTHLYVGSYEEIPTNNAGNPKVGLFPTQETFDPMTNTVTYEYPLESVHHCFIVAAHAEVLKIANGVIVDSQTAWGDGTRFIEKGNWAAYFEYCPGICRIVIDGACYEKSVGWTDGTLYAPQSKCWGTYVTYSAGGFANLIADNSEVAGTVYFSAVNDGQVTITISLNEGYIQNNDVKFTKIQGYDIAPTNKPRPPDFTTYQGKSLVVTVPAYNFYGVHLNLLRHVSCD